MGSPITSNQITNLTSTQVALRSVFFDQLNAVNEPGSDLMQFFNVQSSARRTEYSQGVGGFGDVPEYTGTLHYADFELLYRKTYTHVEYANGVAVSRSALDDDGYGVLAQRARLLGIAFNRSVYKSAASVFNSATATTTAFLGGDSKALVASDHPLSPTNASTQSNITTAALTQDALIAAEQAMMSWTDSKGNPMNIMPDTLIVPVALKQKAEIITGSALRPDTANNDKNVTSGYNVVVSRYLTDSNNWFVVDSTMARQYLNWYWHTTPEFTEAPDSDYNLVAKYRGYMRYSFGFDNWCWVYGGIVA